MATKYTAALEQHLDDWLKCILYSFFALIIWGCYATPPVGWGLLAAWVWFGGGGFGKVLFYSVAPLWYSLKIAFFPVQLLLIALDVLSDELEPSETTDGDAVMLMVIDEDEEAVQAA
jgi:hypothetical protein